jgi:hypothetical protein
MPGRDASNAMSPACGCGACSNSMSSTRT